MDNGIIQIAAGCGDSNVYMDAKDWAAKQPYDDGKNGSRQLEKAEKTRMEDKTGHLGKIVPMVDVRTGPYKEEQREPIESAKARVQKAVDRAMECISGKAYDSTLMDEMYAIQRDEKERLPGMTVKRSGVDIDATRAICEMQDCMLRMLGPIPPW